MCAKVKSAMLKKSLENLIEKINTKELNYTQSLN